MAEWVKAAEAQLELHRWFTSEKGRRWTRGWIHAETRNDPAKGDMYSLLNAVESQKLLTADAIWVAPEISDVIDAARESFRPEPMEQEDFITHTGFLYFDKPLYMLDRNYKRVSVGAISWCPVVFKPEDEPTPELEEEGSLLVNSLAPEDLPNGETTWGMCFAIYSSARAEGDAYSETHRKAVEIEGATELIPLHYASIIFGNELDEGQTLDAEGRYTAADEWWKLVQTSLRLMQQRIATHSDAALPRPTRKRAARAGLSLNEVMVVRLRRPTVKQNGDDEGTTVEWTHRWIVDGHWRNQWYPSRMSHRQVWISPYVKGPDDKELIVKRRFYKWDR
jgi:hypothetical protein